MDLVRDVLDKQLHDRKLRNMGRVDGLIVELRDGDRPRVTHIEVGGTTLACRLSARLARWTMAWHRRWANDTPPSYRIPWSKVAEVGIDIDVALDGEQTPALAWERWLREHVIGRIPGS
jgi:hypothetical protein